MERRGGSGTEARTLRERPGKERASASRLLIIASLKDAEACGQEISERTGLAVEVVTNRRAGLAALRRSSFEVVLVQENLAEGDPGWADQVWQLAGAAVAVQVNFAIVSCMRLSRDVKATLMRMESERASAHRVVASEMAADLEGSIAGLVTQSEIALREPALPEALEPKLRRIVELADGLRERIRERMNAPLNGRALQPGR